MEPYFMSKEKLESKIKDTKNNIILLNNNIKTPDGFEPIDTIMADLANALIDISEILTKYNITKIEGKGITFEDGCLTLAESEVYMENK
jgi:hypothetical protein